MSEATFTQAPEFIKLLAHDLRWHLLKVLSLGDYRVQELVARVHEPMNLVSYHLKKLRDDGVVRTRRSEADGRDVYYSLDMDRLRSLYRAVGTALHPALSPAPAAHPEFDPPLRVLFICTHNSARSQMAEALLRERGGSSIEVYSAGSHPTRLHPDAIRTMAAQGIDIQAQQPKHWQDFADQSFDYVITVCDRAREICPTFPGEGTAIHWGFADPAAIENAQERRRAFEQIARQLASRIEYFLIRAAQHPGQRPI